MRRFVEGILVIALILGALFAKPFAAGAQSSGEDITGLCVFTMPGSKKSCQALFDGSYRTNWAGYGKQPYRFAITLPQGTRKGGLYIRFAAEPEHLSLYTDDALALEQAGPQYAHRWLPFEGAGRLLLEMLPGKDGLVISELSVISGDAPDWVQVWEPPLSRADMLILVAHPDDELIWMGGAIPTYAGQRGMDVAVAYLTCANPRRRSEALNGLWVAGVRNYPRFGAFPDANYGSLTATYKGWGGREKLLAHVTGLYRMLRPSVVLSHDLNGEYGHPAHIACARAAADALASARDARAFPDSAAVYGLHEVPKLYLHLYPENQLEMDWSGPLPAFSGRTALEVAREAFAMHRTQHAKFQVADSGRYASTLFGLYSSLVGPDRRWDDFFENLPAPGAAVRRQEGGE